MPKNGLAHSLTINKHTINVNYCCIQQFMTQQIFNTSVWEMGVFFKHAYRMNILEFNKQKILNSK